MRESSGRHHGDNMSHPDVALRHVKKRKCVEDGRTRRP